MHPRDLLSYPNNLWLYAYYLIYPSYWATLLSIAYFSQNKHFRAALKRLIKSDTENVEPTEDCTGGRALNMMRIESMYNVPIKYYKFEIKTIILLKKFFY